jgi:hypothetical protein
MTTERLSLRERVIGAGLLMPADANERVSAQQKCFTYLDAVIRAGVRVRSRFDSQLMLAILERWYTL